MKRPLYLSLARKNKMAEWGPYRKAANVVCCRCESEDSQVGMSRGSQVGKPTARVGKIFYPKISRGQVECFIIKDKDAKTGKRKACNTFPVLERKGDRKAANFVCCLCES